MLSTLGRIVSLRTASATIVTIVFYVTILIVAEWQDVPRTPPANPKGVDLGQAFQDLKFIATGPHPYNSHRNDVVRDYILDRVGQVAKKFDNVNVVDDLVSNASYTNGITSVYHESLNVIVFVNGTSPNLDHVLLSAHFDSVSTAGGATDDGMGVATLLQLLQYFAQHPPKRSLVFHINNGEEDFLNGAHVFLEHPLSKNIKTFLNLEGAGSGGRPLLFRSSNAAVTRHFKAAPHPHGNSISANAFKSGFIRSGTDYSVYEQAGMVGLDYAFYRHRDQYHTKYDSVSNLGGKAPLWNMIEGSLATAKSLAEDSGPSTASAQAVYFDVLGEGLVVLTLRMTFIINILFLVVGPIAAIVLGFFATRANKLYWTWHGWVRFPAAVIVSIALDGVLVFGFAKVNPFITYSSPRAVMVSIGTLTALSTYAVMKSFARFLPIPSQRQITLIQYYVFWWVILVLDTIALNKRKMSIFFPILFFHAGSLLALLIGLLEVLLFKPITPNADLPSDPDDPNVETALVVERASPPPPGIGSGQDEMSADETTPLLVTRRKVVGLKSEIYNEKQAGGMWLWQYIFSVPFQVLLVAQVAYGTIFGLNGTLADGGSTTLVLILAAFFAFLMVIPLAPFIHKLHWTVMVFLALAFTGSTLYNFFIFPFSPADPLKVFFKQTIDLDTGINNIYLEAVPMYLRHPIVDEIPSSTAHDGVWCSDKGIRPFIRSCRYEGTIPAVAGPNTTLSELVTYSAKRITGSKSTTAQFRVSGKNTRACRIYFEESSRAVGYYVHGASHNGTMQPGYEIGKDGASSIRLWSRTWDREWIVDVDFGKEPVKKVEGRVACAWSENIDSRIPALEEVETFLPNWAAVTKADDGLVEAWHKFSI